jgi:hypothetical protein
MLFKLKRPSIEFEKIFASYISNKGLITRICKDLKKWNSPKNQCPNEEMGKWTEQNLFKEEVQMTKKHMKKCLPSMAIKEMQIKTTLRFHLTLVRIATIKNTTNNKCWQGCRAKGTLIHCWWGYNLIQSLQKMEAPQKSKNRSVILSSNSRRNVNQVTTKAPAHPCLLHHYSQ